VRERECVWGGGWVVVGVVYVCELRKGPGTSRVAGRSWGDGCDRSAAS
jgi:hypothetical protein